jgi:death-on-curing protein
MITYEEVLEIHQTLLAAFGGAAGVRDEGLLKSAIDRPFAGFGESEFYTTPAEKAGAMLESVVKNHPFVDGNKRTGYVLMRLILMQSGHDLRATQDEKYDFVIGVASSQLAFPEIVGWIKEKLTHKESA